jgi:hypothetical protein
MRTMKVPDRISSKFFTENRKILMRFQTPMGKKRGAEDELPSVPPRVSIT